MTVYTSSFSERANREILESVVQHGIASPKYLNQLGQTVLGSQDQRIEEVNLVCVNAFHYLSLNTTEGREGNCRYLVHSQAAGIQQIAWERKTDKTQPLRSFARRAEEIKKIAEERLHNGVVFVIDPKKMKEADVKHIKDGLLSGEYHVESRIEPQALKAAFVPQHLTALFRSVFPQVKCIEVPSIEKEVVLSIPFQNAEISNLLRKEFGFEDYNRLEKQITCSIPDYQPALDQYMQSYVHESHTSLKDYLFRFLEWLFIKLGKEVPISIRIHFTSKDPLVFHFVRLMTPSDEDLLRHSTDLELHEI
jgi:hypothetical protein